MLETDVWLNQTHRKHMQQLTVIINSPASNFYTVKSFQTDIWLQRSAQNHTSVMWHMGAGQPGVFPHSVEFGPIRCLRRRKKFECNLIMKSKCFYHFNTFCRAHELNLSVTWHRIPLMCPEEENTVTGKHSQDQSRWGAVGPPARWTCLDLHPLFYWL